MKFFYCFILLFTLISTEVYAGAMESEVKKARTLKSKGVIKCHPDGKDGGVTPLKALQLLKPGMTLQLLPAQYWSTIEIPQDRVIVTTEGKRINYSLKLKGRDCIVRNASCVSISINEDALILDSVVDAINIGNWDYESKIKIKALIYNTAFNDLRTLGGENNTYTVEMKNCLLKGTLNICSNTNKMTITDSVLVSGDYVFTFTELWNTKKGRLLLKNNLLNGKTGYGRMESTPSDKKRGVTVLDPKDIRKLWSVNFSGEHVYEVPKFQSDAKLFLTEDSPGKGRGLIPDEHPMFEIMKNKKDDDQANPDKIEKEQEERERRRKEELNREEAERERRKKEREEREARENDNGDDDDLGGLPKPPE